MNRQSKLAVVSILIVLLAASLGAIALKQNAIGRLRLEQQTLADKVQEATKLAAQNEGIAKLREENVEVVKLREENRDLPRLRNQTRQLRRELDELTKLRAENVRLQVEINIPNPAAGSDALPPDFISRFALMDAGSGSPEATVQTFFWASCRGDIERVRQLTGDSDSRSGADLETEQKNMTQSMKDFTGFPIADQTSLSPDEVELHLQSSIDGPAIPMKMKRVGGEWKLEGH